MQLPVIIVPVNHQSGSQPESSPEPSSTEETRVSSTAFSLLKALPVEILDSIINSFPPAGRFAFRFVRCLSTYDVYSEISQDAMVYAARIGARKICRMAI